MEECWKFKSINIFKNSFFVKSRIELKNLKNFKNNKFVFL